MSSDDNVTAVIYGGLLGQESGDSIVDALYGKVNPSARLSHSIAKNESDYNVELCTTYVCDFAEGNYINTLMHTMLHPDMNLDSD